MPFMHFEFKTAFSPQQVLGRLAIITSAAPSSSSLNNISSATFFGKVTGHSFKLRRNIRYRNSFLPLISGVVSSNAEETQVKVNMYLHPAVMLFLMVWFGGLGTVTLRLVANHELALNWLTAILIGLPVFGIALTIGGFLPEANIAKRIIKMTLHAK